MLLGCLGAQLEIAAALNIPAVAATTVPMPSPGNRRLHHVIIDMETENSTSTQSHQAPWTLPQIRASLLQSGAIVGGLGKTFDYLKTMNASMAPL